jgi:hypothetical protein
MCDDESTNNPFSLRFPPGMKDELQAWAKEEDRSLANLIVRTLRDALQARRSESPAPDRPASDSPPPPTV